MSRPRHSRALRVLSVRELREQHEPANDVDHGETRPRTRGDCVDGERPCPWVGCRHHVFLDVRRNGAIALNFPTLDPTELEQTCSLDAADQGGMTLDEVAAVMNVTREAVRQYESRVAPRLALGLLAFREDR